MHKSLYGGFILTLLSSSLLAETPAPKPAAQFALLQGGQKVTLKNPPPAGSKLSLCIKAHEQPCQVLLAEFAGNGSDPAPGFKAISRRLSARDSDEISIPACNGQLFVVVAAPDSQAAQQLAKWAQNWTDKRERTAMHDALSGWLQNRDANSVGKAGKLPAELGGTVPTSAEVGSEFEPKAVPAPPPKPITPEPSSRDLPDWLKVADSVSGNAQRPGVFVYQMEVTRRR